MLVTLPYKIFSHNYSHKYEIADSVEAIEEKYGKKEVGKWSELKELPMLREWNMKVHAAEKAALEFKLTHGYDLCLASPQPMIETELKLYIVETTSQYGVSLTNKFVVLADVPKAAVEVARIKYNFWTSDVSEAKEWTSESWPILTVAKAREDKKKEVMDKVKDIQIAISSVVDRIQNIQAEHDVSMKHFQSNLQRNKDYLLELESSLKGTIDFGIYDV
jgi:hypothetical protein